MERKGAVLERYNSILRCRLPTTISCATRRFVTQPSGSREGLEEQEVCWERRFGEDAAEGLEEHRH